MDVDLDPHRAGGDAVEGECLRRGEHGNDAREPNPTRGAQLHASLSSLSHDRRATAREAPRPALSSAAMTAQRQRIGRAAEDLVAAPPRRGRLGDRRAQRPHPLRRARHRRPRRPHPRLRRGQGRPRGLRLRPRAPDPRASTAASSSASAASPPPGWPSAATSPATPRSASTPSASPSTAPAASTDVEHIEARVLAGRARAGE